MGMRSTHFSFRATSRQIYYESVSDPSEVRRQFLRPKTFEAIYAARAADGVLIIVEAFECWRHARNGDIEMPVAGDRSIGLLCVHLTHYRESGEVLGFWNNWGPGWGDRGHGTLPFGTWSDTCSRHSSFIHGRFTPPIWHFKDLPQSLSERELRRCLLQEASRERVRLRRGPEENWVAEVYETQSPTTREQVVCIEIQNGFGLRMGWAFFRYLRAGPKPALEVPELFVWPILRRLGIGAMRDDFAAEYASAWNCSELHLMMNEADAVIGPLRAGARLFGQARGYTWRWRPQTAPRRVATGIKHVVQA